MRWARIALIVGAVIGGLVLLFGVLALVASLTDNTSSPSDRSDEIVGSWLFIGIGLAVFTPCLAVALLTGRRSSLPTWMPGPYMATPPGTVGTLAPNLTSTYLQWFGWCQRELGGDSISLHAATMAAMGRAMAGDSAGALEAARKAGQAIARATDTTVPARRVGGGKVRMLARIGAATLPLLEPGEAVLVSFYATDRRAGAWQAAFGLIGYLIAASQLGAYWATVTDRRLIVLGGAQLAFTPSSIVLVAPRSLIAESSYRRGLLRDSLTVARVTGERNRFVVQRVWRPEAIRANATLAPGLIPTPTPAQLA